MIRSWICSCREVMAEFDLSADPFPVRLDRFRWHTSALWSTSFDHWSVNGAATVLCQLSLTYYSAFPLDARIGGYRISYCQIPEDGRVYIIRPITKLRYFGACSSQRLWNIKFEIGYTLKTVSNQFCILKERFAMLHDLNSNTDHPACCLAGSSN